MQLYQIRQLKLLSSIVKTYVVSKRKKKLFFIASFTLDDSLHKSGMEIDVMHVSIR